eukprot:scaffold245_cov256-Pinguiococcus_pyrenoidosus.AAC.21
MENEIMAQELGLSDGAGNPVQNFFEKSFKEGLAEAEQRIPEAVERPPQSAEAPTRPQAPPQPQAQAQAQAQPQTPAQTPVTSSSAVDFEKPEAALAEGHAAQAAAPEQDAAAQAMESPMSAEEQQRFQNQLDVDAWNRRIMEQNPLVDGEQAATEIQANVPQELSVDDTSAPAMSEAEAFAKLERIQSLEQERAEAMARVEEEFRKRRARLETDLNSEPLAPPSSPNQ